MNGRKIIGAAKNYRCVYIAVKYRGVIVAFSASHKYFVRLFSLITYRYI